MSKADNMLAILWVLKSRKRVTARDLAEELEIHVRTVYRYIDALCASGVPIVAESGHNGGYSLLDSFNEAPLFFDLDEQKSLMHAAVFAKEAGYPFSDALDRAVSKLLHYANPEQKDRIGRHLTGFDVIHPPADPAIEAFLQQLERCVAEGQTLMMVYRKSFQAEPEPRGFDPYGLVHWKSNWYVVGHCRLRGDIRSFRVDRIRQLSPTEERFERPAEFSARAFSCATCCRIWPGTIACWPSVFKGEETVLNDLCDHWLFGQTLVERDSRHALFLLEEDTAFRYVPYWLLPYGGAIRMLEPPSLKERMIAVTSQLLEHYRET